VAKGRQIPNAEFSIKLSDFGIKIHVILVHQAKNKLKSED